MPDGVAILLGWTGSKPRQLRKYERLYRGLGFHPISQGFSLRDTFAHHTQTSVVSDSESMLREALSFSPQQVVIHMFSNGGAIKYAAIRRLLDRNESPFGSLRRALVGVVFDSAPSERLHPLASLALAAIIQSEQNTVVEKIGLWAFSISYSIKAMLSWPMYGNQLLWYRPFLLSVPALVPELYIYSDGDRLVPAKGIERYIAERERRGCKCFKENFGSSGHVNHYGASPDRYRERLAAFLQEASGVVSSRGSLRAKL